MLVQIQARAKALVALLLGTAAPLLSFYQVNQNISLHDVALALVAGVVSGVAVHQVPNKK